MCNMCFCILLKEIQLFIQAPTKKDLVDTVKERGRLAAQSAVVIPRNEKKTKFTVGNLLAKV